MKIYLFKTDYENNSEDFWNWAHSHTDRNVRKLASTNDVFLDEEDGQKLEALITAAPGWNDPDAPAYAKNPVLIQIKEIADDAGELEAGQVGERIGEIRDARGYDENDDDKIVVYRPTQVEFWEKRGDLSQTNDKLVIGVDGEYSFYLDAPTTEELEDFFPVLPDEEDAAQQ